MALHRYPDEDFLRFSLSIPTLNPVNISVYSVCNAGLNSGNTSEHSINWVLNAPTRCTVLFIIIRFIKKFRSFRCTLHSYYRFGNCYIVFRNLLQVCKIYGHLARRYAWIRTCPRILWPSRNRQCSRTNIPAYF